MEQNQLNLGEGEQREWIEDGDELTITGWCQGEGYRVGFGEVTGTIVPAHDVKQILSQQELVYDKK